MRNLIISGMWWGGELTLSGCSVRRLRSGRWGRPSYPSKAENEAIGKGASRGGLSFLRVGRRVKKTGEHQKRLRNVIVSAKDSGQKSPRRVSRGLISDDVKKAPAPKREAVAKF